MAQLSPRRAKGLARRFSLLGHKRVAVAAVIVLVLAVVASCVWLQNQQSFSLDYAHGEVVTSEEPEIEKAEAAPAAEEEKPAAAVVHVDGAVATPGVYELDASARINDAVQAAGGLTEQADTSTLNLAEQLSDGQKIHVPAQGEEPPAVAEQTSGAGEAPAAVATTGAVQGGLLNINKATVEEFDALPGVGPSTAEAIVEDRKNNGPFASVEDLMRVSGIGQKKFEKLQGKICV